MKELEVFWAVIWLFQEKWENCGYISEPGIWSLWWTWFTYQNRAFWFFDSQAWIIFPLTLVLRGISNRDKWELSHIAHRELYESSLWRIFIWETSIVFWPHAKLALCWNFDEILLFTIPTRDCTTFLLAIVTKKHARLWIPQGSMWRQAYLQRHQQEEEIKGKDAKPGGKSIVSLHPFEASDSLC